MAAIEDLPLVLDIHELARVLKTSTRQIYRLRQHRAFHKLPQELRGIDSKPRWSRDAVERFLRGERMNGTLRKVG